MPRNTGECGLNAQPTPTGCVCKAYYFDKNNNGVCGETRVTLSKVLSINNIQSHSPALMDCGRARGASAILISCLMEREGIASVSVFGEKDFY